MGAERVLQLPFARGQTACDGIVTPDATVFADIVGKVFEVPDTEHGSNTWIKLIALRNETGASITTSTYSYFYEFDTAADQFGREVVNVCNTEGAVVVPIDDFYGASKTILEHDVFWGVYEGICDCYAETTTPTGGNPVTSNASGQINDAAAAAGQYVAGMLNATPSGGHAEVFIRSHFLQSEAAG